MVTQRTKSAKVTERWARVGPSDHGFSQARHREDYRGTPECQLLEPAGGVGDLLLDRHGALSQRLDWINDRQVDAEMLCQEVRDALDTGVAQVLDVGWAPPERDGGCGDATVRHVAEAAPSEVIDSYSTLDGEGTFHDPGAAHLAGEVCGGLTRRGGPQRHGEGQRRLSDADVASEDHQVAAPQPAA
jgi:hypothetical protein